MFLREHWDKAFPRKRNTYFVSSLQSQVGSPVTGSGLQRTAQRMLFIGKDPRWPSGVGGKVEVCFRVGQTDYVRDSSPA